MKKILVLVGPTCSGKTHLSIHIGKLLDGEIISADSRQVYRFMDIGTAKPSKAQLETVPHHFIDILDPDQEYNAGRFGAEARKTVSEILSRKRVPIVVGGSGLYVEALIDGFFNGPPADPEFREIHYARYKSEGGEVLLNELRKIDPVAALKMLPSNSRRIVRALEVFHTTGRPISEHQSTNDPIGMESLFIGLEWDRKILYERINRRVDLMLESGLVEEVKQVEKRGFMRTMNALQTVGYKEVFQYLYGEMTYDQMDEWTKRNSRRYAKRQLTWFRPDKRIQWIGMDETTDAEKVAEKIVGKFLET